MNKLILAAFFFFAFHLQSAFADLNECKHRVIFLPQTHASAFGNKNENYGTIESIAKSQSKIAEYLLKHKDLPIFSEQVDTTLTLVDFEKSGADSVIKEYRSLFKNGLISYEELNQEQKQKLAMAGADATLLMLGKVPILHKVVPNRQIQDQIFSEVQKFFLNLQRDGKKQISIDDPIFKLIYDKRENLALAEINAYFDVHPEQRDVILIYGRNHQFARHPEIFPSECILVPFSFQSDHTPRLQPISQQSRRVKYRTGIH